MDKEKSAQTLTGKTILLIIGGGIAAYKTPQLIRLLKSAGATLNIILSAGGSEFVTPLTLRAVSETRVYDDLFAPHQDDAMDHIRLSRTADLILVVPATANLMARMANGLADDLASSCLLAANKPIMIAPAMNVQMWLNPATQRNLDQLRTDGIMVIGPDKGDMACGEYGPGRMSEVDVITNSVVDFLQKTTSYPAIKEDKNALKGKKVLITSGATVEAIDPVRFISNRSSGKQGTAIARAFIEYGAEVIFITGTGITPNPDQCQIIKIQSAADMAKAVGDVIANNKIAIGIFCAAVSDWKIASFHKRKLKKQSGQNSIKFDFVANPDILANVSHLPFDKRPQLVIGFAAETDDIVNNAQAKLKQKQCDWLIANQVGGTEITDAKSADIDDINSESTDFEGVDAFGSDRNKIVMIRRASVDVSADIKEWPVMTKTQIGQRLAREVNSHFTGSY